jgi:hypothetical protein
VFDGTKVPGVAQNGIGRFTDGGDGFYYGAAGQTLFKIKKDGTGYSVLRKFDGAPTDAASANEAPILGSDGKLYGFDTGGGQARGGTFFTLGRDGNGYKLIVDPDPGPDPLTPAALVEGTDGKLYAYVHAGLARFNKDGSGYEVLKGTPDSGEFPWTALVHGGALYGVADEGPNRGLIYRYGMGGGGSGAAAGPTAVVQNVPPTPLDAAVDLPSSGSPPAQEDAPPSQPTNPQPPAQPATIQPHPNAPGQSAADKAAEKARKAKEAADKLRGLFGQ